MRLFPARATRGLRTLGAALALVLSLGVASVAAAANSAKDHQGAWQYFIRGDSAPLLQGWQHPGRGLPAGWTVHDGVLSKGGPVDDLVSTRKYKDFELELEWNIGKEGNSGIFYRATHQYDQVYWTGPEYQLLDDQNAPDGKHRITAAGSVYGMYPSPAGVVHPYGHWNEARIVVRGNHVTYWMNGRRIVDYDLGSPEWKKRVAASKFSAYPGYGRAPEGLIGIQGNHPGAIKIRNMRIRVLP
jgi:3-keto-disaccharide hydrolase